MNAALSLEISQLDEKHLRQRILLAWAVLRVHHVLLAATAETRSNGDDAFDRYIVVRSMSSEHRALENAAAHAVFLEDHYPRVSKSDFHHHLLNSSRAVNVEKSLSKLFILPIEVTPEGSRLVHCIFVMAHQISDGMSLFRWASHFTRLMNSSTLDLTGQLRSMCSTSISPRLPPAQESLYPTPSGSRSYHRWSWLLSRILRHTRHAPHPAFSNPLRRIEPLTTPPVFSSQTYSAALSYSSPPPLCTQILSFSLSTDASRNLSQHCSQLGVTIGAGLFTLVAMSMMMFHERINPHLDPHKSPSFVGSFPLNPRPFLAKDTTDAEDSLILGFSDGISLPYIPTDLPLVPRFRVLARLAHRQLRVYQKRKQTQTKSDIEALGSRNPSQLIPHLYLNTLERFNNDLPPEKRMSIDPQGAYPASVSPTGSTCGVSSVGDRQSKLFSESIARVIPAAPTIRDEADDTKSVDRADNEGLVATYRGMSSVVRARDGEFLVGTGGNRDALGFGISYDANMIDPELADEWVEVVKSLFEPVKESGCGVPVHDSNGRAKL